MHVLVIEDDVPTAKTVERALRSRGHTCEAIGLGEVAVDLAKARDYDIILLDLMLPDIDGYEVLRRLQAAKVQTPVLVQTGLLDRGEGARAPGLCGDDHRKKQFGVDELLDRMQFVLGRPNNGPGGKQVSQGEDGGDRADRGVDEGDQRSHRRHRTIKLGQIIFRNATCNIDCVVLNMSEGGAALQPADILSCPEAFTLKLQSGRTYRCEVCWQHGDKLGVRFVDA